jgi:hypothetical protein
MILVTGYGVVGAVLGAPSELGPVTQELPAIEPVEGVGADVSPASWLRYAVGTIQLELDAVVVVEAAVVTTVPSGVTAASASAVVEPRVPPARWIAPVEVVSEGVRETSGLTARVARETFAKLDSTVWHPTLEFF